MSALLLQLDHSVTFDVKCIFFSADTGNIYKLSWGCSSWKLLTLGLIVKVLSAGEDIYYSGSFFFLTYQESVTLTRPSLQALTLKGFVSMQRARGQRVCDSLSCCFYLFWEVKCCRLGLRFWSTAIFRAECFGCCMFTHRGTHSNRHSVG